MINVKKSWKSEPTTFSMTISSVDWSNKCDRSVETDPHRDWHLLPSLAVGTGWPLPPCVKEVHCTIYRRRNELPRALILKSYPLTSCNRCHRLHSAVTLLEIIQWAIERRLLQECQLDIWSVATDLWNISPPG